MLFHSSLRKELARSFGATLIVLATVIMTMTLIRTLGQASMGKFNPSDVSLIMGYTVLAYMPTILTMSLFIASISTLSRMYRDSEMVIWFNSGHGLLSFLNPLFRFAWPVFLVVLALSTLVLPWSNQQIDEMKSAYERRSDLARVEPGQFQESAGGQRVFFIDKDTPGARTGSNVFIASTEPLKETITSARQGRIDIRDGEQYLLLQSGQRLERNTQTSEIKISEFSSYGTRIGSVPGLVEDRRAVNTLPTQTLLRSNNLSHRGELSWRFGMVLAALNFVILAVAVSNANPRVGRSASLGFSMASFVVYYNLISLGQNWVATGQVRLEAWLLALHGGAFVVAVCWLLVRRNQWRVWPHTATRAKRGASR